ncbi:MAG: hypothetical protein RMK92_10540, partial [Armatimonadota bacterium]|nr:hypothetical protein [Armatimonadota bacterium]
MEKLHYPWTDTKPGVYSSDEEWISWRAYCRYMQRSIVFGVSAELPRLEKVGREPVVQVGVFAYHTTDSPCRKGTTSEAAYKR